MLRWVVHAQRRRAPRIQACPALTLTQRALSAAATAPSAAAAAAAATAASATGPAAAARAADSIRYFPSAEARRSRAQQQSTQPTQPPQPTKHAAATAAPRPSASAAASARPVSSLWSWGAGFLGGLGRDSYDASPLPLPVDLPRTGMFGPTFAPSATAVQPVPMRVAAGWSESVLVSAGGSIFEWGWRAPFRLLLKATGWHRWAPWLLRRIQSRRKGLKTMCGAEPLRPQRLPGWGFEAGDEPLQDGEDRLYAVDAACGGDFMAVLSSQGQVYTWGNNFYGQLGHSLHLIDAICREPRLVCYFQNQHPNESVARHLESGMVELPSTFPDTPIVAVSAGFAHMLILTRGGQVYSCGKCDTGALGITHIYRDSKRLFFPHLIPVTDAYASGEHGAGEINLKVRAEDSGEHALTSHQLAQNDPSIEDSFIGPMVGVAAGMKHSLFLNAQGDVFACGTNGLNELGNNTYHPAHGLIPVRIPLMHAPPRRRWRFRRDSSAALESPSFESFFRPSALGVSGTERIMKVSAGQHHSLALSNKGHVYAWGLNQQGQCGQPVKQEWDSGVSWIRNVISKKIDPPTVEDEQRESEHQRRHAGETIPDNAITPYIRASVRNLASVNRARASQVSSYCCPPTRIPLSDYASSGLLGVSAAELGVVVDIAAGFHDSVMLTDRGYCIVCGGGLQPDQAAHMPYLFRLDQPTPGFQRSAHELVVEERVRDMWRQNPKVKQIAFGLRHALAIVQHTTQDSR